MVNNKLKTFLIALFCVVRCILFPKTKICVASATRGQANEVLSKIVDDFMKNYTWGSENLKREISYQTIGTNKAVIKFHNGSWIKVVTASDTGRSNRANILVCDEFWMMDSGTITSVLKKFLTAPRSPGYLNDERYSHLQERNKEMYAGSAWMKAHWSYAKARSYTANMLDDKRKYFVCGLPYQLAMYEGLLSREQIQDEMSESDFDEVKFETEMGALFYGSSEDAFFKFEDIDACRRLKSAVYPEEIGGNKKAFKIPDLALNERRIMSVDIALMASNKRHKNDAASIIINSALPTTNNEYIANIIYLDNKEGFVTNDLALEIRKLFDQYKCTDLVIDAQGLGLGVYDALIQDIIDHETGKIYPALSCCNNQEMADRCAVPNAPKVIWSIKANQDFNSEICVLLRNGFKNGKINLLISDKSCDDVLKEKIQNYSKLTSEDKMVYKLPYIQTSLLAYELINLTSEISGTKVKVKEKSGMRKDRYSSLAYNYWVQCQLEREVLRKPKYEMTMADFASQISQLCQAPLFY